MKKSIKLETPLSFLFVDSRCCFNTIFKKNSNLIILLFFLFNFSDAYSESHGTVQTESNSKSDSFFSFQLDYETDVDSPDSRIGDNEVQKSQYQDVKIPLDLSFNRKTIDILNNSGFHQLALQLSEELPLNDGETFEDRDLLKIQLLLKNGRISSVNSDLFQKYLDSNNSHKINIGMSLGDYYLDNNNPEMALKIFKEILSEPFLADYDKQKINERIAKSFLNIGDYTYAELVANSVNNELVDNKNDWTVTLAKILLSQEKWDEALGVVGNVNSPEAELWTAYIKWKLEIYDLYILMRKFSNIPVSADNIELQRIKNSMIAIAATDESFSKIRSKSIEFLVEKGNSSLEAIYIDANNELIKSYEDIVKSYKKDSIDFSENKLIVSQYMLLMKDLDNITKRAFAFHILNQDNWTKTDSQMIEEWLINHLIKNKLTSILSVLFGQEGYFGGYSERQRESLLLLLNLAVNKKDFNTATEIIESIKTPLGLIKEESWILNSSRIQILAGNIDQGVQTLQSWITKYDEMEPMQIDRVLQILFDLQFLEKHEYAIKLFREIARLDINAQHHREILYWIAVSYLELDEPIKSSVYFLQSADLARSTDVLWAQSAYMRAGQALESGGFYRDAKSVYQYLLQNTSESKLQAKLRYKISRIGLSQTPLFNK